MDALFIWIGICAATGLAHVLTLTNFLHDVVFDTMLKLKREWQFAHELFLVYLERVETCDDRSLNLQNVFAAGAQDTLMVRAEDRVRSAFNTRGIFRPVGGGDDDRRGSGAKWNGSFNRDKNAQPCFTFNLGRKEHPASCLNERGGCRFAHVCDHWVSDKGPKGICRSDKHSRANCDNPAKCDAPVA